MKSIIFFALLTTFAIGFLLGYRKGQNRPSQQGDDKTYIEEYMNDHKEYLKGE